jgi:2-aminoethylphosphonate-pyruvate transaminase
LESIKEEDCKNVYLNLCKHYYYAKTQRQTPNTPNVTLFWALNTALTNILNKGLDEQINTYRENAKIIRDGIKKLGLTFLLDEKYMSNTVTSVFLTTKMNVDDFLSEMESDGYVLYVGKGKYHEQNMFQIANMGKIFKEDCNELLRIIAKHINK